MIPATDMFLDLIKNKEPEWFELKIELHHMETDPVLFPCIWHSILVG